ncbi:MAG: glycosyltransferase [bacterium]|nr:glycosyltransferase [bacterium]
MHRYDTIELFKPVLAPLLQGQKFKDVSALLDANSHLIELDPELQAAQALCLLLDGRMADASRILDAIPDDGTSEQSLVSQTKTLLDGQRIELSCFKAIEDNSDNHDAIFQLAAFYERTMRFEEALPMYQRLESNEKYQQLLSVTIPYLQGICEFTKGNVARARMLLHDAISNPINPSTFKALQRCIATLSSGLIHPETNSTPPQLAPEPEHDLSYPLSKATSVDDHLIMIWSTTAQTLDPIYLACIERAAKVYPDKPIYLFSNGLNASHLGEASTHVTIVPYKVSDIIQNTPLETWTIAASPDAESHPFWFSHQTDVLRFALLFKYGGIYLDTDVFLAKKVPKALENSLFYETMSGDPKGVCNGVLAFQAQHPFIHEILNQMPLHYNPKDWGCIGPDLVTKVFHHSDFSAHDVKIVPYEHICPVTCDMRFSYTRQMGPKDVAFYENTSNSSVLFHLFGSSLKQYNKCGQALPKVVVHPDSFLYRLFETHELTHHLYTTQQFITDNFS